jgi:hypothetical protein
MSQQAKFTNVSVGSLGTWQDKMVCVSMQHTLLMYMKSVFHLTPLLCTLFNNAINCWDHLVSVIHEWMRMEQWWNDTQTRKLKYLEKKPVPVPLCPLQIPRRLPWDWTWPSKVTDQILTAWGIPWLFMLSVLLCMLPLQSLQVYFSLVKYV